VKQPGVAHPLELEELVERFARPLGRADAPPDPVTDRRLCLLALQVCQQFLADPVGLPFFLAHVGGQPLRRLVCVRDRALPEAEVLPDDQGPVGLDRPAVSLVEPQVRRRNVHHVHQPRYVGDGLVRDLAAAAALAACRQSGISSFRARHMVLIGPGPRDRVFLGRVKAVMKPLPILSGAQGLSFAERVVQRRR
jgi:hypothetical protein